MLHEVRVRVDYVLLRYVVENASGQVVNRFLETRNLLGLLEHQFLQYPCVLSDLMNVETGLGHGILVCQEYPVCIHVYRIGVHTHAFVVIEHLRHDCIDRFDTIDRRHMDESLLEPLVTLDRDEVHAINDPEPKFALEYGLDRLLGVPEGHEGNIETVRHFGLSVF